MASAEELYKKWCILCPPTVKREEFEKVIWAYLGTHLREVKGTSHILVVEHEALKDTSTFGRHGNFTAVLESGRKVKRGYIARLLKAIKLIHEYETEHKTQH